MEKKFNETEVAELTQEEQALLEELNALPVAYMSVCVMCKEDATTN